MNGSRLRERIHCSARSFSRFLRFRLRRAAARIQICAFMMLCIMEGRGADAVNIHAISVFPHRPTWAIRSPLRIVIAVLPTVFTLRIKATGTPVPVHRRHLRLYAHDRPVQLGSRAGQRDGYRIGAGIE